MRAGMTFCLRLIGALTSLLPGAALVTEHTLSASCGQRECVSGGACYSEGVCLPAQNAFCFFDGNQMVWQVDPDCHS